MNTAVNYSLRDYQQESLTSSSRQFLHDGLYRQLIVLPTGMGKCHRAGTPILMFDGAIKKVEDIVVGDLLMGPDSTPRRVLALGNGEDEMYKVIPRKGDPYTVNSEHILSLKITKGATKGSGNNGSKYIAGTVVDISVKDYLSRSDTFKHCAKGWRVGVDFPELSVDLHPYYLGLWLGDGTSTNNNVTSTDGEVVEWLASFAASHNLSLSQNIHGERCPVYSMVHWNRAGHQENPLTGLLRKLDVISNKHVPHAYKANSRNVRLQVLAGLLDSDGHLTRDGVTFDFVSKSEALAIDTAFLARSLGMAAYIKQCEKFCQTGGGGTYYRVQISGNTAEIPTLIKRKRAKPRAQKKDVLLTGIKGVEPVGRGRYYGFEIDGDHRYLLGDFTVTHNTVVFASAPQWPDFASWLATFPTQRQKILVLAHRDELITQAANKISAINPGLIVEIEKAEKKASPMTDVIVASVQTLKGRRLQKISPEDIRLVVIDEAHHSTASSYTNILEYLGILPPATFGKSKPTSGKAEELLAWQRERLTEWDRYANKDILLIGFTATPRRSDNIGLEAVFQDIVYSMTIREGIERGYLTRLRAIRVLSKTSLDGVKTLAGDFNQGELSDAVNTEDRNKLAVKAWLEHAVGRKTVAFCASVAHSHDLASEFQRVGIRSVGISGSTSPGDRSAILRNFHEGGIEVLTNCQLLTEGFDEPNIQCVLHCKPTKSSIQYIQMTGRGTRLHPGKEDCLVIDVVDVTRRHSLITAPELFGLPAGFDGKGDDLLNVSKKIDKAKEDNPGVQTSDLRSLDELQMRIQEIDIWTTAIKNEVADNHGKLTWIADGDTFRMNMYRAENNSVETVQINQNALGHWQVDLHAAGKTTPIAHVPDIKQAFKDAEQWIADNRPAEAFMKDKSNPWRHDPPSSGQIEYARKLRIPEHVIKSATTKGALSNLIELAKSRQPKPKFTL